MPTKLTRETFLSFACNPEEEIIARFISEGAIEHISLLPSREERQFAFRCVWVPFEMSEVRRNLGSPEGRAFHVWQFALTLAHSRMLMEMSAWGQDPRFGWWPTPASAKHGSLWWMKRYDSHLRFIDWSYRYWVKRKCPDCCHPQEDLAAASRLGFFQHADREGLRPDAVGKLLAEMKKREQSGSRESEFFHKYAQGVSEPRWDYPEIDLWLIEVWPLV